MSSEESSKMSQKNLSQDSNSDIEWDIEELKKAIVTSAEDHWDAYMDAAGQIAPPPGSAEAQWEFEKKKWKQQYHEDS